MARTIPWFVAIALMATSVPAGAGEQLEEFTMVLRTRDDPNVPADLSVCQQAPFPTNVAIGASVWAPKVRIKDAQVIKEFARKVGTATACFLFTDLRFLPFSRIKVYASFNLPDGVYTGVGECLVTSNSLPQPGIVLTGCTATLLDVPDHVIGGIATTTTLMNVGKVPGYVTGSFMTLRGFRLPRAHGEHGHHDGDHEDADED